MDIQISNGTLTATINPKGAELNSLKKDNTEYIWEGNPEFWGKHSPVLFPIVGTLKNNSYLYNGTEYTLSRHGFARDNIFTVKEQQQNRVVFSLVANDSTRAVYPFDFELELIYTLDGDTLSLEYIVTNKSDNDMPFSIGAHPAFALPGNFEDYSLQFEKDEQIESVQLEDDLISDKTELLDLEHGNLPLTYKLFENDALIIKSAQSREITIKKGTSDYIKVTYPAFPHLGLWTKVGAPFLCIEPWQGYSDSNNASGNLLEKEGIVILKTQSKFTAGFKAKIF
ncbi:aldose 1-epimerase family protein [Flavobacterium psychrotrophum]|uniref:aldose 1-epimerase family protein n=1 Tax=Flavobacterium psychrotrophum TaxID=2294119 RepID=UPI000E31C806|nr:aldose 1-epimerase family protein [Flavobacterium psychrotrophum]